MLFVKKDRNFVQNINTPANRAKKKGDREAFCSKRALHEFTSITEQSTRHLESTWWVN